MILKRITIKRFKAIMEKTIQFSPGLNIIKGSDNEAGKSSLRQAIVKVLYEDPTTRNKEVTGLTSWGMEEPWEVELEFQTDSESYRVTKSLKDQSCKLIDLDTSEIITDKNAIRSRIAQLTGCPSEVFFQSTACIGQEELIKITPQSATPREKQSAIGDITRRLQSTLTGAEGVDVLAIVSRLKEKTHRKPARGPYNTLLDINARIKSLEQDKVSSEEKVSRLMDSRRKLNKIKEQLQQINEVLPSKKTLLDKNKKIFELQKEVEGRKVRYGSFKRAKQLKSQLDNQEQELAEFAPFVGQEENIQELKNIKNQIEGLGGDKSRLEGEIKTTEEQKNAQRWVLIAGLIVTIASVLGLLVSKYVGIAAIPGLLMLVYWLVRQKDFKAQIKSKSDKLGSLQAQIRNSQNEVTNKLSSLGFKEYSDCITKFQEYNRKIVDRKTTADKLSGILGEKDWSVFEEENEDFDIQISAAQKELDLLLPSKLEPIDFQKLENEVIKLQDQIDNLEKEKAGLERFFEYTDADTDQLATIQEQLKWQEEERQFYERKMKVYEITRETLDEAHRLTLSKATDTLEKEVGSYVSTITGGRYDKVKVNESDLSMWTVSPEKKDEVEVDELSRATQDQFYISARLALVKLITDGKKPPLLLDDPFVNFHPKRLGKMISFIQHLARENQILLFTCSDAYDHYGNAILVDEPKL